MRTVERKSKFSNPIKQVRGYVLIIAVVFIPLMMLATKYVLDYSTEKTERIGNIVKKCAKQAALEVAKKWNPGLSYKQQKEAMLRIADEVYNASPAYSDATLKYDAIPGLEMPTKAKVVQHGVYYPSQVIPTELTSLSPSSKTVEYKDVTNNYEQTVTGNLQTSSLVANETSIDALHTFYFFSRLDRDPALVLEDTVSNIVFKNPVMLHGRGKVRSSTKNRMISQGLIGKVRNTISTESATIPQRVNPDDNTVQISVENDTIKVITDNDVGYAKPAKCNVDIVLGLPINGAACNQNNYDGNTTTSGSPYDVGSDYPDDTLRTTPIYQIAQGFRTFIKNHFYYTQGTNIGLIPYAAQCCLDPDKAQKYMKNPPKFVATNFLADQNQFPAYIRRCNLYDTWENNEDLTKFTNMYPDLMMRYEMLMMGARRGLQEQDSGCGNNIVCAGDLLSTADPLSSDTQTFLWLKNKYLPDAAGHANLLSMKYEKIATVHFTPNPYFIVGLQSDALRITDLLNVTVPFCRRDNIGINSNFIFIPVTWANNLFQSWMDDPKYTATDTSSDSVNLGRLSCPSKLTSGRKKAVIIVVNKPDWFEPGELTYIGYDNDFSEIPLIESDCIRGDINYSDTSQKFADGSTYDGTIQGAKKILKLTVQNGSFGRNSNTGWYENTTTNSPATVRLNFPKKYLVKVVVEPQGPDMVWEDKNSNLQGNNMYLMGRAGVGPAGSVDNQLVVMNATGILHASSDGTTWTSFNCYCRYSGWYLGPVYGNNTWVIASASSVENNVQRSSQLTEWESIKNTDMYSESALAYGNGIFMLANKSGHFFTSQDGENWTKVNSQGIGKRILGYGEGRWIAGSGEGSIYYSTDNGHNWNICDSSLANIFKENEWYGASFAEGYFYVVHAGTHQVARSKDGTDWKKFSTFNCDGGLHRNITYYNNQFYVFGERCGRVHIGTLVYPSSPTLQFPTISCDSGSCVTSSVYEVTKRREFFIEPSQMTANYIDMKMTNVRLISAEITNRPYEKITPSCYLSGTTSGTGRAEITVNAKVPLKIDVTPLHTLPSITFHGNNEIEDNVGRQALTGRKEFKFSGANVKPLRDFTDGTLSTLGKNFAHNLSKYKIRYTLQDAKITNATLTKQFIRHYGCHFNRGEDGKALIINDGRQGVQLRASDWGRYVYCYPGYASSPNQSADKILLTSDSCLSMTGSEIWSGFNGWGFADLDIDATFGLPGINKPFVFWSYGGWRTDQKHYIGDKQKYINTSTYYLDSITVDDSVSTLDSEIYVRASVNQFFIENLNDKSLLDTALDTTGRYDEAIQQNEGIALQHLSSDLSDKIVAGDYICFQGDGELTVTVEPTDLGSSFSYLDAQKSNISMEINNTQTVIISPETHYYEPLSDGKYQITLNIELVQLSNLQLLDPSVAFTYKNPRLPRDSRVVDFSKNIGNSPEYNSALISRLSLNLLTYDNDLQYWISSKTSSYPYSEFYNNNIVGDFYFLVEDIGSIAPQIRFFNRSKGPETFSGVKNELYLVPGLHRRYQYFSDTRRKEMASFDWPNSPQGGQVKYIWAGFTMPVNAMLYYGAGEGTTHKYQWQSDKRGENVILGPTEAVKNVTKDACAKLKSDWGSNLRLYIIKYRKQTQYKHLVTGSNVNFDYSYLNNCATGTAAPYMYDVSDESGLKTALDTIATDIKNWAGYEEAKNVSEND